MFGLKAAHYPLVAVLLSLVAAFPWLWGISYSKGNDFFYWVHFAWLVGPDLLEGGLPDWTMFSGCGQPTFNLDHIPDAIIQGLLTLVFGLEGGIRAFVVLCYVLGGLGTYALGGELVTWRRSALVGAVAYLLSWHLTRTADFYVYTSNLLQCVLLPWIVLGLRRAVYRRELGYHLATAALVSVCIMANPQTAIKVVALAGAWVLLECGMGLGNGWLRMAKHLGIVALGIAWFSASHIAIALIHRRELYTFGQRGTPAPRGLAEFFYVPLYAIGKAGERLLGVSLTDISLRELIASPYLGLSVILVALCAIGYKGRRLESVRVLWILSSLFLLAYFAASWVNPSEWIGAPRKMIFAVAFCAALLCAFGSRRLEVWARFRGSRFPWGVGAGALVFGEMLVLKCALFALGTHHVPLVEIPQVRYWRQIAAAQEWGPADRFYTFQPDLTFMVYPALVGKPVANRIHQRDYTAEFWSFQDTLNRIFVDPKAVWPRVSEYLALANIRYLELPRDGFSGRFKSRFPQILDHFARDGGLSEIGRRESGPAVADWFRHARGGGGGQGPVQVVYANERARPAFVARRTVAILGDTWRGEKLFEEIALQPGFVADEMLFLLSDDPKQLADLPLDGYLRVEPGVARVSGLREWSIEEVKALYGAAKTPPAITSRIELQAFGRSQVTLGLAASNKARFLFVSLQRFADWHAYDQGDRPLQVFKTGAGLTGVLAPAGTERVALRYERPVYKQYWRAFSLAGWGVGLVLLLIPRIRQRVL